VAYTPREPQIQLRVRAAIMADRDACGAIDTTYTTDSVWQLDQRQDDNEIRIGLRQISLPKPMAATEPMDVPFVSHADTLWLVAEELEVPPAGRETIAPTVGTVVGFLTATIEPRREMVYLRAVAVARDYRRQHLGSALIEHMRRWAAREGVPEITADVSAKNAPALRLLQRSGFRFCGYSDRLYRNGEVALFLAMAVR
jgi:ribosomal protein S18 acetylase RimI-like enzyme